MSGFRQSEAIASAGAPVNGAWIARYGCHQPAPCSPGAGINIARIRVFADVRSGRLPVRIRDFPHT
jgi:hypothetical protein